MLEADEPDDTPLMLRGSPCHRRVRPDDVRSEKAFVSHSGGAPQRLLAVDAMPDTLAITNDKALRMEASKGFSCERNGQLDYSHVLQPCTNLPLGAHLAKR